MPASAPRKIRSPIRVLVADDDSATRRLVATLLSRDPEIHVVGTASDGAEVLEKLEESRPDVLVLDMQMPVMDGMQTLAELRRRRADVAVIMFSAHMEQASRATLRALAGGASDYVQKPTAGGSGGAKETVASSLVPKIKDLARRTLRQGRSPSASLVAPKKPAALSVPEILVVGVSTGGPQALNEVLGALPADFPIPILIAQHMPPTFTRLLAQRLAKNCAIDVVEGTDGAPLQPGIAVIAPGDYHMEVRRAGTGAVVHLHQGPQENFCRPAADLLLRSAARLYGSSVLALVLTGMGRDGLQGCQAVSRAGGQVLVQDEATSSVWGMPGAVAGAGLAHKVLPLERIALELQRRTRAGVFAKGGARAAGEH